MKLIFSVARSISVILGCASLSAAAPNGLHSVSASPVNPNINADGRALFGYLKSIYGNKTLSGQQDNQWLDYVTQQTQKSSAVLGLDFMDYSPSRLPYGATSNATEQAFAFNERGGIVTFVWHWNAPTGLYNTAAEPWYSGFYTAASDFNVSTAMADTTNANYTLILRDIDAIAVQLGRLQDAGIPILFRVLHEADGGWFWWGAQGPEPCKKLWALVYDRITNFHGLNNILWVWNSLVPDWYPGDDTVDIVSTDVYAVGNDAMATQYNSLITLGGDTKMVAVAEVGSIPRDDLMVADQAQWLWFLCWGDQFINNPTYNPPDLLKSIYNSDEVLTLDEIQGWKG